MDENIDLKEVLRLHGLWLSGDKYGRRADLSGADLRGVDLGCASLGGADLSCAGLDYAYLRYADLSGADLSGASLYGADLYGASLRGADLRGADLNGVDLSGASLYGADLYGASLRGADLRGADLNGVDLSGTDLSCATFDDRIFCLDRIGSVKRRTTYNATKDIVWCGCFTGTFDEWVEQIRTTYPDENNVYRKEYEAAIAFFKTVAAANEEKAQNG